MTSPDPATHKAELRVRLLAARAALPVVERLASDRARDLHLVPLLTGRVAAYVSFGTEPGTGGVLRPGDLLPVLRPDKDLDWCAYPSPEPLGVDAIATADLVLVPALAVDHRGVRLGRGGGSYDRALARARGTVLALLHEGELVEELPSEEHDVRVHGVVTPSGVVRLPL